MFHGLTMPYLLFVYCIVTFNVVKRPQNSYAIADVNKQSFRLQPLFLSFLEFNKTDKTHNHC